MAYIDGFVLPVKTARRDDYIKECAKFEKVMKENGAIRVFDMELTGFKMPDSDHATVVVDYQWMRIEENMLRQTRIEQSWRNNSKDSGWVITRERRVSGDPSHSPARQGQFPAIVSAKTSALSR